MKCRVFACILVASCGPAVEGEVGPEPTPEAGDTIEGAALQHIDRRADGTVAAVGFGDFRGRQGDDVQFGTFWVGTFAPDGALVWSTSVPLDESFEGAEPSGVALAADGSVFVSIVDYVDVPESANRVSKYGADGALQWDTLLDARPLDVVALTDGGAVAVGYALLEDTNAISAWAVRLSASGEIEQTRSWPNPDGLNSSFASVDDGPSGLVAAGTWGLGPLTAESQAWIVFTDSAFQATTEVRLPHSGGTDFVLDALATEGGARVAVFDADGEHVSTVSSQGEVSSVPLPEGLRFLGFAGPSAHLASDECEDCDAHLFGIEDGAVAWEEAVEGCRAQAADGVALESVAATFSCEGATLESQLWWRG